MNHRALHLIGDDPADGAPHLELRRGTRQEKGSSPRASGGKSAPAHASPCAALNGQRAQQAVKLKGEELAGSQHSQFGGESWAKAKALSALWTLTGAELDVVDSVLSGMPASSGGCPLVLFPIIGPARTQRAGSRRFGTCFGQSLLCALWLHRPRRPPCRYAAL